MANPRGDACLHERSAPAAILPPSPLTLMTPSRPTPAARCGLAALSLAIAFAGVAGPVAAQLSRAAITGVSNPASIVCARPGAGGAWCTVADRAGRFRIAGAGKASGAAAEPIPRSGTVRVFNMDCERAGVIVDRGGRQRGGGAWLDVRCGPEGCMRAPRGLLAYYPFDEASPDSAADQPNIAAPEALRLRGGAARDSGRVRGALRLDGHGWAEGGAGKNVGKGDFSVAVWVRADAGGWGPFGTLLDKRDWDPLRGYHVVLVRGESLVQLAEVEPSGVGGFNNYYSGVRGQRMMDGAWHFLVVTVERASPQGVRWYLDSEPAGVVSDPTARRGNLSSASPLYVGRHSTNSRGDFRGSVDELQIYNRVLTPEEIADLYGHPICR